MDCGCLPPETPPCSDDTETPDLGGPLMNVGQATIYLAYASTRTLNNLRYRKSGPPYVKLPTGSIRYRQADLDAWCASPEPLLTWEAFEAQRRADRRRAADRDRKARQRLARKLHGPVEGRS